MSSSSSKNSTGEKDETNIAGIPHVTNISFRPEGDKDHDEVPPSFFPGGLQGLVTGPSEGRINFIERKCPRIYNSIVKIFLPLLLLICLAFFCGHFLADLESDNEISSNNRKLSLLYKTEFLKLGDIDDAIKNSYDSCITQYEETQQQQFVNITDLSIFLGTCTQASVNKTRSHVQDLRQESYNRLYDSLNQNWIICQNSTTPRYAQSEFITWKWFTSFYELRSYYVDEENLSIEAASELAANEASGTDECKVHTAAGALVWFTIFSTIGYGHVAPETVGGRIMTITLGLLSIICFTAIIGQAGYVLLTIADDAFFRIGLQRLTKGYASVFFWLIMLVVWTLINTWMAPTYINSEYDGLGPLSFFDYFWFSYITVTTVGFGDIFIPHDEFRAGDMFYVPLINLLGFVVLSTFLQKLSEFFSILYKREQKLLELLEKRRNAEVEITSRGEIGDEEH